jgi:amino acid adenylation domain-containing protein/non-ribosomal peptide synthase protein (TIGR01720 family)
MASLINGLVGMRAPEKATTFEPVKSTVPSVTEREVSTTQQLSDGAQPARPDNAPDPRVSMLPRGLATSAADVLREVAAKCSIAEDLIEGIYPVASEQQARFAGGPSSLEQLAIRLTEQVDLDRLRAAWDATVAATDVLRTRIAHVDCIGGFIKVLLKHEAILWEYAAILNGCVHSHRSMEPAAPSPLFRYTIVADDKLSPSDASGRYLLWTVHRAIIEPSSIVGVLKRVDCHYNNRPPPPLPPPTAASWDNTRLNGVDGSAVEAFWRTQLSDLHPTQFPALPSATYVPSANAEACAQVPLSAQPMSSAAGKPPTNVIIESAWALLIALYTDNCDVAFGVGLTGHRDMPVPPQAGQDVVSTARTIVPFCLRVDWSFSVGHFLQSIHTYGRKAQEHAPVGGVAAVAPASAETRVACKFQSVVSVVPATGLPTLSFGQLVQGDWHDAAMSEGYAVVLRCTVAEDNTIGLRIRFDDKVVDGGRAHKFAHQLGHLIQQLASADSHSSLRDLVLVGSRDLELIRQWNKTASTPAEACAHHLFAEAALTRPDAAAICSWDGEMTFEELDRASTTLAATLAGAGAGSGQMVLLCFPKTKWYVVAMLAVMKVSAAFVPLDPAYPQSRIDLVRTTTQARVALCLDSHVAPLADVAGLDAVIKLPKDLSPGSHGTSSPQPSSAATATASEARPDSTAYVLFTSGSTGIPKGVVVPHAAICTSMKAHGRVLGLGPTSRTFQFSAHTFDVSILEILTTLVFGGCVCIPSQHDRLNDTATVMTAQRANLAILTPSLVQSLGDAALPFLSTLCLAGEPADETLVQKWAGRVDVLMNGYGPTECAVLSTLARRERNDGYPARTIGFGLGCKTWVVDRGNNNRLMPVGAIGELVIDGPIVGRGYLGNTSLTAESFISSDLAWAAGHSGSCSAAASRRQMYKTGDLVKYHHDGSLVFVGRKDGQVKLRGQRLELGEVEHNLVACSQVQHAIATVPNCGLYQGQLVAVITLHERFTDSDLNDADDSHDTVHLRPIRPPQTRRAEVQSQVASVAGLLSQRLPGYMVPERWAVVERLPILSSGKLDRRKVQAWVQEIDEQTNAELAVLLSPPASANGERAGGAAASGIEQKILAVWAKVLNKPEAQLGRDSAFAALGGDSLTALRAVAQCRAQGIRLTMQDMLRGDSLARVAGRAVPATAPSRQHAPEQVDTPFALSPVQQMFFEYAPAGCNSWNQSIMLRVKRAAPPLAPEDFELALEAVVRRHSMLRARFVRGSVGGGDGDSNSNSQDGGRAWVQLTTADTRNAYLLTIHGAVDSLAHAEAITAAAQQRLDITWGPLLAAEMMSLAGEQLVFLAAHHLVVDLMSWRVIVQDLARALETGVLPADAPLSFQAWCALQAQHVAQHLTPQSALPTPVPVPPADYQYWGLPGAAENVFEDVLMEHFTLDADATAAVLRGGAGSMAPRTEPVELLLGVLCYTFRRTFRDRGPAQVFNEAHGREPWSADIDLSSTVGWFTTMHPLPVAIDADDDLQRVIAKVTDARRRIPGKGWPYYASRYLHPDGRAAFAGHSPIEVLFNYAGQYNQPDDDDDDGGGAILVEMPWAGVPFQEVRSGPRWALFEITASVVDGQLTVTIDFSRRMKHQSAIRAWISAFNGALATMAQTLEQS